MLALLYYFLQVSIRSFHNHVCGGTLIGAKHVISAVHCFTSKIISRYSVGIGYTDRTDNEYNAEYSYKIKEVIKHAFFSKPNLSNDLAVVVLEKAVDLTSNPSIKPACLPWLTTSENVYGKMGVVSGWGDQYNKLDRRKIYNSFLQKTYNQILNKNCSDAGRGYIKFLIPPPPSGPCGRKFIKSVLGKNIEV